MTASSVPRRSLGRQLKKLREDAGVSAAAAAKAIEVSKQTLWRIESGQLGPKLKELYVSILCAMYGAGEAETNALVGLVAELKKSGWWHSFGDPLSAHANVFLGFEEGAKRLTVFEPALMPELLQTSDYRRAVLWIEHPNQPTDFVENRVEIHRRRLRRLTGRAGGLELRALIGETVLHTMVGGPAVMSGQLRHLLDVATMPNISIRVIPRSKMGACIGLITGAFIMMEFPAHPTVHLTEPPLIYIQGYTGGLYLDKEHEIRQYRCALAQLQHMALGEEESKNLISRIVMEYAQ
ncbi:MULTISPECIES: helix-turn-helix transcriptional regulator [unclassified Nocardia]|uniref:helix-turn-helix domain-containing protein n=1 Tax=unclassified Nocardia TaxID=2637762 RepID=UPI001CE46CF7|nr:MULTISPECIES: helix-turn-helix transcriptional regulator [unclassified Nocardia]